jgi:hypothetical protein
MTPMMAVRTPSDKVLFREVSINKDRMVRNRALARALALCEHDYEHEHDYDVGLRTEGR